MSDNYTNLGVASVLRSLVTAKEFAAYEKTGRYNLGADFLNQMVKDLGTTGKLNTQQHARLKKRLSSCELNVHLDALPGAKRRGAFVLLPGGLVEEQEWPVSINV